MRALLGLIAAWTLFSWVSASAVEPLPLPAEPVAIGTDPQFVFATAIAYAQSKDGLAWERPRLGLYEWILRLEFLLTSADLYTFRSTGEKR